ncbi:MAG TPA: hypothetical protein VJ997_11350, partial [Longimicrobiales bacterium]|nr:hypothetical protein [Longimicrobiales bacterium]
PLPPLASLVSFGWVMTLGFALVASAVILSLSSRRGGRAAATIGTWACGYTAGTPRMQYTASSFADPLVRILAGFLRPSVRRPDIHGPFPGPSRLAVHVDDVVLEGAVRPSFAHAHRFLARMRVLQGGHLNLYVFIILLGTLALLLTTLPILAGLRALWME